MNVTATHIGFFADHFKDVGDKFEIPDKPSRKVTDKDDAETRKAAVKGDIPCAFSSTWMAAGWIKTQPTIVAPAPEQAEDSESVI